MDTVSKKELLRIIDIINNLATCSGIAEFNTILKRLGSLIPYEASLCAYGNVPSHTVERIVARDFPVEYLHHYLNDGRFLQSPCIKKSFTVKRAHFCSIERGFGDAKKETAVSFDGHSPPLPALSNLMTDTAGHATFFCLTDSSERPHPRHLHMVDILMPHLHHAMCRLNRAGVSRRPPALTGRETEVLKWTAEGKTNWEISKILNISEATVKFHLANIFRKLDAVGKGHAVAKALQLGILAI